MGVCQATAKDKASKYQPDKPTDSRNGANMAAKTAKLGGRKKKNKKKGYHKDIGEDYTIHENFTIMPRQASSKDVKFIINSLLNHFFFKTLSNEEIENVITRMFYGVVDKDQYIFRQGDQASCFFIIHEGSVSVEIKKAEGVQKVKDLNKKEYFGELALMYNSTRSASIKANVKTKLWAIDRQTFKRVVEEGPTKNFKENREFIEKVPFFDSMTDSQKDAVTMALLMQAFNKGEIIINEGDQAASYYIIKEGEAECVADGKVVRNLKVGESFGEQALYESATRTLTVRAGTDLKCVALSRDKLQSIMGSKIQQVIQANWTRWALEKDQVLQRLTKLQIERLIQNCEFKKLTAGETLLPKGSKLTRLYMITNGELKYDKTYAKGEVFLSSFLYPQGNLNNQLDHDLMVGQRDTEVSVIDVSRFQTIIGLNLEEVFAKNLNSHEIKMLNDDKRFREKVAGMKLHELVFIKRLGEGQFGKVLLVKGKDKEDIYALKAISKKQIMSENLEKHTLQEREVLNLVNFPFIMRMYRTFQDDNFVYFLLSYEQGLELFEVIRKLDEMSNEHSQFYIGSMILAVEYLHKKKIVYRDLKPENIIIHDDGYLKLIDMGTAKVLRSESGICRTSTVLGTPHYMAPEILKGKGYGLNVDLWSIGVMLYEFMCAIVPFGEDCEDPQEIYALIDGPLTFPEYFDIPENKVAKKFMEQLMNKSPDARLGGSYATLKAHKWFEKLDWDRLLDKNMDSVPFRPNTQDAIKKDLDIMIPLGKSVTTEISKLSSECDKEYIKKSVSAHSKNAAWDKDF